MHPPRNVGCDTNQNNQCEYLQHSRLTKKEPPPTRDANRDSGTDRANGGSADWLGHDIKSINGCRIDMADNNARDK
jgi:hypothetical protein